MRLASLCLIALAIVMFLSSPTCHAQAVNPALNGKIVYFVSSSSVPYQKTFYSINPDGSGVTKLFSLQEKNGNRQNFSMSADGNVIACWGLEFTDTPKDKGTGIRYYIQKMNSDGTQVVQLPTIQDSTTNWRPSLDAYGRKIVVMACVGNSTQAYIINTDGSGLVKLTQDPLEVDGFMALSPQGDVVVIESKEMIRNVDEAKWHYFSTLFVVSADGKDGYELTPAQDIATGHDHSPVFTPDGRRIAFLSSHKQHDTAVQSVDICIVNHDGTERTCLTDSKGFYDSPHFSPDGQYIAYNFSSKPHGDDQPSEIWVMKADGSDPHCLGAGKITGKIIQWVGLGK